MSSIQETINPVLERKPELETQTNPSLENKASMETYRDLEENANPENEACSTEYLTSALNGTDLHYLTEFDIQKLHLLAKNEQSASAMYNLGHYYLKVYQNSPTNWKKGLDYILDAAKYLNYDALALLAVWLQEGIIIKEDPNQATKYLKYLVQHGYPHTLNDFSLGVTYFYRAAHSGNLFAKLHLESLGYQFSKDSDLEKNSNSVNNATRKPKTKSNKAFMQNDTTTLNEMVIASQQEVTEKEDISKQQRIAEKENILGFNSNINPNSKDSDSNFKSGTKRPSSAHLTRAGTMILGSGLVSKTTLLEKKESIERLTQSASSRKASQMIDKPRSLETEANRSYDIHKPFSTSSKEVLFNKTLGLNGERILLNNQKGNKQAFKV